MTLVCAYKNQQTSFIISDFRITRGKDRTQNDQILKFLSFGKKLGLFLAGDVEFWKNANSSIQKVIKDITLENCLDINAVFWQELSSTAINYKGRPSSAIGFILDPDSHLLFKLIVHPGIGAKVVEIPNNECVIIGSGCKIPGIESILSSTYERLSDYYNDDAYCIASSFRTNIVNEMTKLGSQSFEKLGISPVMAISILKNNSFKICGEAFTGSNFDSTGNSEFAFEITKNENEDIIISDQMENSLIKIFDINAYMNEDNALIFDPANLTKAYDPSIKFESDYVYLFEQTIFKACGVTIPNMVIRNIDRIDFITNYRFCKNQRLHLNIKKEFCGKDFSRYLQLDKKYFVLDKEEEKIFLREICPEKLFDHEWLNNFIPEYTRFYNFFYPI